RISNTKSRSPKLGLSSSFGPWEFGILSSFGLRDSSFRTRLRHFSELDNNLRPNQFIRPVLPGKGERTADAEFHPVAKHDAKAGAGAEVGRITSLFEPHERIGEATALERPAVEFH